MLQSLVHTFGQASRFYSLLRICVKKYDPSAIEYQELEYFNTWILSTGNGDSTSDNYIKSNSDSITVEIPTELLIQTTGNKIEALVRCT